LTRIRTVDLDSPTPPRPLRLELNAKLRKPLSEPLVKHGSIITRCISEAKKVETSAKD